uniref:Uncharacterized protein n=1 Tax=Anguilla anguilla TaxID=7936 RepID=A0A0E9PYW4_ANGAN
MRFVYHITPYLTSLSAPFVSNQVILVRLLSWPGPFCKEL